MGTLGMRLENFINESRSNQVAAAFIPKAMRKHAIFR